MQAKVVWATVFFLLNIYFVCGASTRSGNIATCVGPQLTNITTEVGQAVELIKEALSVINATQNALRSCISGSASSNSGSSSGEDVATCLTIAYTQIGPEVQDVIQKYRKVVPSLENLITSIKDCLAPSPDTPPSGP